MSNTTVTCPWLGSVAAPDLAAMTAESERLGRVCRDTLHTMCTTVDARNATLTPEQQELVEAYDEAKDEHHSATFDWYIAEIGRHLPGIAPAITAVWAHVREETSQGSTCCLPDRDGDAS
jgi:hypothetical protein